jgi:hypothetical protein
MPIHIDNETHWRTPDIRRVVKAAFDESGEDPAWPIRVSVIFNTKRVTKRKRGPRSKKTKATTERPVSQTNCTIKRRPRSTLITLKLPKNGPKDIHDNSMVAIAAAASARGEGQILAASHSFFLANFIAFNLTEGRADERGQYPSSEKCLELGKMRTSTMPPAWADATKLVICKVKDPKLDGTYLDFVKKKKRAVSHAEVDIERETAVMQKAKRRIASAQKRKKAAEKALQSAAERRS